MKYRLCDRKHWAGTILHRIQALRDIPEINVKQGDLGGWISGLENLSQEGTCWIFGEAVVTGKAKVKEHALIRDRAIICDNALIYGFAQICDSVVIGGYCAISGNTIIASTHILKGRLVLGSQTLIDSHSIFA